jgi:hypothetical protein
MLDVIITEHGITFGQHCTIILERTLRTPDDQTEYHLPAGLGVFPVFKVADYWDRVPSDWHQHNSAFIPMYQREALWIAFDVPGWKPHAVQIAAGSINVISGTSSDQPLRTDPQNYIVCPKQLWLDGFNTGHGSIRQFVAMPLGRGYSVEASLTGTEEHGGLNIKVFAPKPGKFPDQPPPSPLLHPSRLAAPQSMGQAMGLGAGGVIKQKIYPDPYGLDAWDEDNYGEAFIYILNSAQFAAITGLQPPQPPVDAKTYSDKGLPWFELDDELEGDVGPAADLAGAKTIAERDQEQGETAADGASFEVPADRIWRLKRSDRGPEAEQAPEHMPDQSS